jgi:lipoprotein-releasing system ATP-binding protein
MDITLSKVTKSYGEGATALTILSELSATFKGGHSYAVRGPSGIGKSTLLQILARLDNVTSGEVSIGDTCISALSEEEASRFRRDHIGMIFQFHHLLPEFSARENIMMPLLIQGKSEPEATLEADRLLERVGIENRATHLPAELSGGEQQRVAIARALVAKPALLLADEPTGNLDPSNAELITELLLDLVREIHGTLIVVTHSPSLAGALDVQYEMQAGGALVG